ncbi:hypothetical protein I7I50_02721 [Histoplasma capsulatum G186AR]|uniref:Uncharacterized protein n=1 Tax=Ajellomyces capsulatus TaxID=5037 RepID=A0A8H7Z6S6_AJECA|nr:hypothetical protein I7I52_00613 [Histoplasma capsulatum]QSS71753.1 hypothetical protein I7I50_02721 [Histoplasma capsulatum G186AR]
MTIITSSFSAEPNSHQRPRTIFTPTNDHRCDCSLSRNYSTVSRARTLLAPEPKSAPLTWLVLDTKAAYRLPPKSNGLSSFAQKQEQSKTQMLLR